MAMSMAENTVTKNEVRGADPMTVTAALIDATEDFIEALLEISAAKGPWPLSNDNYDHACNVVASMQKIAVDVLRKHGFTPRGKPEE
jgi:hypothetical protein